MPTAEEVLIRLRAEADESIQEIDRTTERVQELKAEAGSIDLDTSKATEALGELEGSLGRSRDQLAQVRDAAGETASASDGLAASQTNLQATSAAAAVALVFLRKELSSLQEIQAKLADGVDVLAEDYPRLAEEIKDGFSDLADFITGGPITQLNNLLDDGIEAWKEYQRVFEPALEALINKGEDAQTRVEALFDEIRRGEGDLRRTQSELLLAAQGIERAGEASDATRIEVFNLATSLREDLRAAGVEVSESLNELIERYRETAEAAEATTERAVEAAKRQAEETAAAARRQAEDVIAERQRQAEAAEEAADRELDAAQEVVEKEREILQERLESLEEFREGFERLQSAQAALAESFEESFNPEGISETAEELGRVQARIEELQGSTTLTIEQNRELDELRRQELDLIEQTRREESAAAAEALSGTEQVSSAKEALGDVITAARDKLEEFRAKFGEVSPAVVGEIEAIIQQLELQAEQTRVNEDEVESLGIRLESAFNRGERAVEQQTRKLEEQIDSLGLVGDEAESLGERLEEALGRGVPLSEELLAVFQEQADALRQQREEAGQIAESLQRVQEGIGSLGEGSAEALAPTTEALAAAAEESLGFADNIERGAAGVSSLVDSAPELTTSLEEQGKALADAGPELRRYADEAERAAQSVREIADQSLVAADNQAALAEAVDRSAASIQTANGPLDQFRTLIRDIAQSLPRVSTELDSMAVAAESAGPRAVAALAPLLEMLANIEAQAASAAAAISALDDLGG